uniref:Reverse transcriptase domain-containing protein n=1 Tax=Glossina pallidipes TaxID=7398 RepID=A0A1A9Z8L6_GLOPL
MECVLHFGRMFNNADPHSMWNQSKIASNSGSINENVELVIDHINNYFLDGLSVSYDNICEHTPFVRSHNTFSFACINSYALHTAFGNIESNACSVEAIPFKFLNVAFPLLSNHILHLFHGIITTSVFPENWKLPKVIPVPSTGASFNTENLRPISILPIVSKVLEHVIISQISRHIAQFHLLNDRQTGMIEFRVCSVYAFAADIQLLFHGLQSKDYS